MAQVQVNLCLADPVPLIEYHVGWAVGPNTVWAEWLGWKEMPSPLLCPTVTTNQGCFQREAERVVTKEMGVLHGTLMSLGKRNGCPGGEGVTGGVLVFGQGQNRIINAQLRVKLKLPARRPPTLLEVLTAAKELLHHQVSPPLAPTIHSILLTEVMRPCPGDLLGKGVRGREAHYASPQIPLAWLLTQRT